MMVKKIISGAQTGADRAGLDAGLHLGLRVGGTVPRGRRTDEGPLTDEQMRKYCLVESRSPRYPPRTERNVRNSDGTVLFGDVRSPGTKLTIRYCEKWGRPHKVNPTAEELGMWERQLQLQVLNVAGNRERTNPGIYQKTFDTIVEALRCHCIDCETAGESTH